MNPNDDDLRRLIRDADPASALPPLRSDERHRLLENAMNTDTTSATAPSSRPGPSSRPARASRRGPIIGAIAGVAALAAAALALPLIIGNAGAPDVGTAIGRPVTTLMQPAGDGAAAMCAMVTPEGVGVADQAFRATVDGIGDDTVSLSVEDRYTGEVEDTVTLPQGSDTVVDGGPILFEDGETYLIAAVDGTVMTCGASGVDSPELTAIYDAAFD